MKLTHLFLIALMSPLAFAGVPTTPTPRHPEVAGKRVDVVKIVPHLSASSDWKSQLILRNDQDYGITIFMDFYAYDGLAVTVRFYDDLNVARESNSYEVPLNAFETKTVDFDRIIDSGLYNLQAYLFTSDLESGYSVEYSFSNFQGPTTKVATVANTVVEPGENFFMNVDERVDPYTGNKKLRGLAFNNVETTTCECTARLYNQNGVEVEKSELQLLKQEKFVGTVSSLFGNVSLNGLYLLDVMCDRYVSAVGLSFENGTPIVGSAPIEYYTFSNGKKVRRSQLKH